MRTQAQRAVKQEAFDEWKAKNPVVFAIRQIQSVTTVTYPWIRSLNGLFAYQRTAYQTFVR